MKNTTKRIVDVIMYILLLLCMGYQLTGNLRHEIAGVLMLALFVVHLVLNGYWFRRIGDIAGKAFRSVRSGLLFLTDVALLLDMIVLAVTSVWISRNIFVFLGLTDNHFLIWLHHFAAYSGLIIISVHIGCHWKGILASLYRLYGIDRENRPAKLTGRVLALVMAVVGVVASFQRGIGGKLMDVEPAGRNSHGADQTVQGKTSQEASQKTPQREGTSQEPPQQAQTPAFDKEKQMGMPEGLEDSTQRQERASYGGKNRPHQSEEREFQESISPEETQEEFLAKLTCTGCGKRCPLLSPRCGTGMEQAQQAIAYYLENATVQEQKENEDIAEPDSGAASGNKPAEPNGQEGAWSAAFLPEQEKIVLEADDSLLQLLTDYIPITGLYIAGTYYALEYLEYKKKKKEE